MQAKPLETSYLRLNIPEQWACALEASVWKCHDTESVSRKKVLMTITAKKRSSNENLKFFESYFRTPKSYKGKNQKPFKSIVQGLKRKKINRHPWVESFHYGGEAPLYYTHYLATVYGELSILVSYSYHRSQLNIASQTYYKTINSLRLKEPTSGRPVVSPIVATDEGDGGDGSQFGLYLLIGVLLLVAILLFAIYSLRSKR